jgi:hypothetical protein
MSQRRTIDEPAVDPEPYAVPEHLGRRNARAPLTSRYLQPLSRTRLRHRHPEPGSGTANHLNAGMDATS